MCSPVGASRNSVLLFFPLGIIRIISPMDHTDNTTASQITNKYHKAGEKYK
jgi:hypothetical protein